MIYGRVGGGRVASKVALEEMGAVRGKAEAVEAIADLVEIAAEVEAPDRPPSASGAKAAIGGSSPPAGHPHLAVIEGVGIEVGPEEDAGAASALAA